MMSIAVRGAAAALRGPMLVARRLLALAACCVLASGPLAQAFQPLDDATVSKLSQPFVADELAVQPELEPTTRLSTQDSRHPAVAPFLQRYGGDWEMRWDLRSNRPNLIQGSGIPLIPGSGNSLTPASLGLAAGTTVDLPLVGNLLRDFISDNRELLKTDGLDFRLDAQASTPYGADNSLWFIEFAQYQDDVRVDGADLFFRISHGNIVQFGSERVAPVMIDTQPRSAREDAFAIAWQELGFPAGTTVERMLEPGELVLLAVSPDGTNPYLGYRGVAGAGYAHWLAWRFRFRVQGSAATWQVLFNAHTERVIEVRDLNAYADATVSGGIYPVTNSDPEVVVPFPFTAVANNGNKVTDTLGIYDYSSGTATSSLNGKYFRMQDDCGSISLSDNSDGNLAFGTSGGTNCTTPGFGGSGNTHASRTGFYHLTKINEKARSILTSNSWLQSKVTANMNINDVCNAYWNGFSLNFFKSGSGCSNTGEIAAVFLHEWGHGLDSNTGGSANEYGSGEAVGDTFAFLETRDACIGPNFIPGQLCHNCTTCTGVRDVGDFSLNGTQTIASPANVTSNSGIDCDAYIGAGGVACPYIHPSSGAPYQGPMGYEGHCESLIASSANWDLTQSLVDEYGEDAGYEAMDRIWYGSLTPSKSAYRIASGGQCNPGANVDGCASNNWYTVFLASDDDDGNLANGTPNACRIWDAFDAHGIACGTRPTCSAGIADFSLSIVDDSQTACAGDPATYLVEVGSTGGFANSVTLATSGLPAGAGSTFSPNPVTPGTSSSLNVTTGGLVTGTYPFDVDGSATGSAGHNVGAQLIVVNAAAAPTLTTPANGATGVGLAPTLTWNAAPGADSYRVEIATDAAFANIVASQGGLATTSWTAPVLAPDTAYFWRVRATNACGNGAFSPAFTFTTGSLICSTSGFAIPDGSPSGVNDTLTFSDPRILEGMLLHVAANHTWVGDIKVTLSHGGESVVAIDRPGVPASTFGCGEDDIDVILDDSAASPVEGLCSPTPPAIGGTASPNNALDSAFAGMTFGGTWTLNVSDNENQDTGSVVQWCLEPKLAVTSTFTVGGDVDALFGSGLVLSLNGVESLPIAADGPFTFSTELADGASYEVSVATQPHDPSQSCGLANETGTIDGADVTNVIVLCAINGFHVGGTVSGLEGSGLVLRLNGTNDLPIGADGTFQFPVVIPSGNTYAVTVATQPSDPSQSCTVTNGDGTVGNSDVTDVEVTCTTNAYTIGGTVGGLLGDGLVLSLNGGAQTLPVGANGSFTFPDALPSGTTYTVTVATQPSDPSQSCVIANGSGTVGGANVTSVEVTCSTNAYTIGGSVGGLVGDGLVLSLNGGAQTLPVGANGSFTFPDALPSGVNYAVTVATQPTDPSQSCVIANGSGTVDDANVTGITVTCSTDTYTIGGTVGGLLGDGLVLSLNGGAQTLPVGANGSFTFPDALPSGATYTVTVATQPSDPIQTCAVANGSGTVGDADVSDIAVNCTDRIFADGFEN